MTVQLLARDALRNVALFSASFSDAKTRIEKRDGVEGGAQIDVLVVEDLPVFRSGTFRDSLGYQHTWEPLHMDQLVSNFNLMKSRGYLVDVPVRKDHPGFLSNRMEEVVGYHTSLKSETRNNPVDGTEQTYVLATFEVTDPGAIDKISRGLWRNVSAEVGSFTSNNETEFWPAYQGVAYVDIPAVEGLKSFNNHNGVGKAFSLMLDNEKLEDAVTAPTLPNPTPSAPASATAPTTTTPAVVAPTDLAYHGRANFTFSIGGRQTNDFAAVQAHITTLEAAQSEAKLANRQAFIKGLAEGSTPKILASQIPSIEGYALKMDDESWGHFQKAHEDMPALSSVSTQSNAVDATGGAVNSQGTSAVSAQPTGNSDLDTAIGVLEMHFRSGMKPDQIKATPSYAKVKSGKPDHPLLAKIPA